MWRDSGKSVRFFIFDGRSAIFILLFLVHITSTTFYLMCLGFVFFAILERMGYTYPNAMRAARLFCAGKVKRTSPWWMKNKYR